jgi:hypothetical protein
MEDKRTRNAWKTVPGEEAASRPSLQRPLHADSLLNLPTADHLAEETDASLGVLVDAAGIEPAFFQIPTWAAF